MEKQTRKLLQINPVIRTNTSTGRIMQEIGELAIKNGWQSYIAYSKGRDGVKPSSSEIIPVGDKFSVAWHGVMTRLFDCHGLASNRATRKFIREIERIKPDIIHIHNIHGYFLNYKILFDYLSKCEIPVIWTIHDCWLYTGHCYHYSFAKCDKWKSGCGKCPQQHLFPASLLLDRSAKNYIDKSESFTSIPPRRFMIAPVSDWIRSEMSNSFLKDCQYRVIHNGIDLNIFAPTESSAIKSKYGLPDNKHIILGLASIWSKEKGWDDFMQLATRISDDEVIVLVGIDQKQSKMLPPNIIGISRTDNITDLAALYSVADVFVNPTWQDNYPTVNLEAIACGTPVITYRTGGSVEAITDKTGVIVEQGDVDAILEAIRDIESKGKDYYREDCREYAVKHFNKVERYADYLQLYEEMLSQK
ncbi:MAG: glycosyltransferase [Alistipes sp.]|nr:glycosyltransferase [Alistipes sp.]